MGRKHRKRTDRSDLPSCGCGLEGAVLLIWDNDDFFGGIFDFDSDGQTDIVEAALGYQIFDEMDRDDDENNESDDN